MNISYNNLPIIFKINIASKGLLFVAMSDMTPKTKGHGPPCFYGITHKGFLFSRVRVTVVSPALLEALDLLVLLDPLDLLALLADPETVVRL